MDDFELFNLDIKLRYGDIVRRPLKGEGIYEHYVIQSYHLEKEIYYAKYESSSVPSTGKDFVFTKDQLIALKCEYSFTFKR